MGTRLRLAFQRGKTQRDPFTFISLFPSLVASVDVDVDVQIRQIISRP